MHLKLMLASPPVKFSLEISTCLLIVDQADENLAVVWAFSMDMAWAAYGNGMILPQRIEMESRKQAGAPRYAW
jgi:hypothetical protein